MKILNTYVMDRQLIKEALEKMVDNGYIFTISGTKADKTICLVKNGKAIVLYKGFWNKGQQYHSMQGSFRLAEKLNEYFVKNRLMCQATPSLIRPYIIDLAKQVNLVKNVF